MGGSHGCLDETEVTLLSADASSDCDSWMELQAMHHHGQSNSGHHGHHIKCQSFFGSTNLKPDSHDDDDKVMDGVSAHEPFSTSSVTTTFLNVFLCCNLILLATFMDVMVDGIGPLLKITVGSSFKNFNKA